MPMKTAKKDTDIGQQWIHNVSKLPFYVVDYYATTLPHGQVVESFSVIDYDNIRWHFSGEFFRSNFTYVQPMKGAYR